MEKGIQSRFTIHKILIALRNNTQSYDIILKNEIKKQKFDSKDINLIQAVVMDSLRFHNHIEIILKKFVKKKLNEDAFLLFLSAITQLIFLDFKDYAVINSTVELSKNKKIKTYPGFINAVLNKILKNKNILKKIKIKYSNLPRWFINETLAIKKYSKKQILDSIIEKPDLHLVFKNNMFMKNFLKEIKLDYIVTSDKSLCIKKYSNIEKLPRYYVGEWWVQDFSAMLPIYLTKNLNKKKIIDLCAAPGGKSFQLLSQTNNLTIMEKNSKRAKILNENLVRLNYNKNIIIDDSMNIDEDLKYDLILIDAPCSSIGTIRKNPEILFRKKINEIDYYLNIQDQLLQKAAKLTKKNSEIIYMVCSFFEKETKKQIENFLNKNQNFSIEKFSSKKYNQLIDEYGYINTIPNKLVENVKIDGFFAAKVKRND